MWSGEEDGVRLLSPLEWHGTPGWRFMLVPVVFWAAVYVNHLALRFPLGWLFNLLRFPYYIDGRIYALGFAGWAVLTLTLVLAAGLMALLDARGVLYIYWPLLPGAFFLILCAGLVGLEAVGQCEGDFREAWRTVAHDLALPGVLGVTAALLAFGGMLACAQGSNRACPKCGAWWARVIASSSAGHETEKDGHFASDGSGWKNSEKTTYYTDMTLVCRKCAHEWSGRFSRTARDRD